MASASRDRRSEGIEFIHENDGSITAKDIETGLARGGATRAAALSQLAEVLALAENDDEPIEDPDAFLQAHGIEPASEVERPPWE